MASGDEKRWVACEAAFRTGSRVHRVRDSPVQVPAALGLGDDQIVRFAEGITVTADAQTVGG